MTKTEYTCDICGVGDFTSPQKMGAHKRKEHPGQPKNPKSNKTRKKGPKVHVDTYDGPFAFPGTPKGASLAEAIHVLEVKRDALEEVIGILRELEKARA